MSYLAGCFLVRSYPSMNGLAVQVREVAEYFEIKNAFGVGVGLGANVLARFAVSPVYGPVDCITYSH